MPRLPRLSPAGIRGGVPLALPLPPPPTPSVSSISRAEEQSGPGRRPTAPPPPVSSPHGAVRGGNRVEGCAGLSLMAPSTKGGSNFVATEGSRCCSTQAPLMPALYSSSCSSIPAWCAVSGSPMGPTPGPSAGLPLCTPGGYIADPVGTTATFPVLPGSYGGGTGYAAVANSAASVEAGSCGSVRAPSTSSVSLPSAGGGAGFFVPSGTGSAQGAYCSCCDVDTTTMGE